MDVLQHRRPARFTDPVRETAVSDRDGRRKPNKQTSKQTIKPSREMRSVAPPDDDEESACTTLLR